MSNSSHSGEPVESFLVGLNENLRVLHHGVDEVPERAPGKVFVHGPDLHMFREGEFHRLRR